MAAIRVEAPSNLSAYSLSLSNCSLVCWKSAWLSPSWAERLFHRLQDLDQLTNQLVGRRLVSTPQGGRDRYACIRGPGGQVHQFSLYGFDSVQAVFYRLFVERKP